MTSRDGWSWTKSGGLKQGVPSIGVIQPATIISSTEVFYDVIIVGAGYTGLTAARDASVSGLKVLLLEARDRIGGRSWSSNINGYSFEMGGTWVSWEQPHDALLVSGLHKFVNVDGAMGRKIIPFPHDTFHNPEARQHDNLSAQDRLNQIAATLSPNERAALEGFMVLCSGSTMSKMSFLEFLHWWALCGYNYQGCIERLITYKFKGGQSSFAIRFFQEALATGNLSYAFNTPIQAIQDKKNMVEATSKSGRKFQAARLISTIPLNVLNTIAFDPPLDPVRKAAADIGHVNQCIKVHAEVTDKDMRSWTGVTYPRNQLFYAIGDGTTPAGNTHIVAFGGDHFHFHPEENVDTTLQTFQNLAPGKLNIQRLVFHNWSKDEFAKGAWFFSPPNLLSTSLDALRERHGNILLASSDWAVGWRSFIDGAIEEGTRAALTVKNELAKSAPQRANL
ncbi:hypothetical protein H2199_003054 [Coniosporium tulheliwenetii]|uniref:Uncharacterized protein n=1 Tax=Coniosporium tulheliwenetii TaxID=3383036 RepID=A0ACC2ZC87_9PEZI|nr:hypothetical protein H2199_003054 [Cladosporium sp. JES 115]